MDSRVVTSLARLSILGRYLGATWGRLRAWRRIRFTGGGLVLSGGSLAVGFAAVNTGNNLLYLLLGAMLGFIVVSGWVSERMLRDLEIAREAPRRVTAGQNTALIYRATKRGNARGPSLLVEVSEAALSSHAMFASVSPGKTAAATSFVAFARRGVYPLSTVTLSTGFPFGLFLKARDIQLPGFIVVWPRTDRPVRALLASRGSDRAHLPAVAGSARTRGEFRSLLEYRPGDDAHDIHWKTSARLSSPVVREYERDASEDLWICLDTRAPEGEAAESLVEIAASLAAQATSKGRRFALTAGGAVLAPGAGGGQLEAALDLLARVSFAPDAQPPSPPAAAWGVRPRSVLVSLGGSGGEDFSAVFSEGAV